MDPFSGGRSIGKLREAEVELARGTAVAQACKKIGITEQTYYRWRKAYGGHTRRRAENFPYWCSDRGALILAL